MNSVKVFNIYTKCKEMEAIETVMSIIKDSNKNGKFVKGTKQAVTIEYLMDLQNDIMNDIYMKTGEDK